MIITRTAAGRDVTLRARDVEPLEGTLMSLWNSAIPNFWTQNGLNDLGKMFWPGDGTLASRVWIASRCIQMNSQQIGSMPLRFEAPNVAADGEPAWVSNPDPLHYPNGISSVIRAMVADYYAWGYALAWVTSRYADGYPRNWTRIPARNCTPRWGKNGYREYKIGEEYLNPDDVIQIDRDEGCYGEAHGTSAIYSYAQKAWSLLAAGNQAMSVAQGGIPFTALKITDEKRKQTAEQAQALQTQWMQKAAERNGAPPVLPYGLDFEAVGWNPKDMALIETQEFDALALAAAYGVPAVLLNMAIRFGMTYQNPGMLGEMWWRFELRPTAKIFADAFTAQALPTGQWVWLDAKDTFLALDTDSEKDDPQAENELVDMTDDDSLPTQQQLPPAVAKASPAQKNGAPRLASIGGNR